MTTKDSTIKNIALLIKACGEAAGAVIGAIALGVFFCGPAWLPWYKR